MDVFGLANADAVLPGVKAGDPAAQEALYRAFEAPVYNLARRICRTTEDAEDVLQETFLEVFRSIARGGLAARRRGIHPRRNRNDDE